MKHYDLSITEFKNVLDIEEDNVLSYIGLGEAYKGQQSYSKAIYYYS
jgi:hypothetical protein